MLYWRAALLHLLTLQHTHRLMPTTLAAVSTDIRITQTRELPIPEIPADAGLLKIEMTDRKSTRLNSSHRT